jgi:DNA-binding GntR family transcriptional regulator
MTLTEYMDPAKFPLTTQKGLSPQQQMMIDAMNYDDLREMEEAGRAIEGESAERAAELRAKHDARPEVTAELKAGR